MYCLGCANLKAQLNHERNRVLFFQNENRRLELREIRSPLEDLDEGAIDAEFGMDQPQATAMQSEDAYAPYDASIQGESLPMMSPALSVVPEGDEHEGEIKQQLEAQGEEQAEQEPNVGEVIFKCTARLPLTALAWVLLLDASSDGLRLFSSLLWSDFAARRVHRAGQRGLHQRTIIAAYAAHTATFARDAQRIGRRRGGSACSRRGHASHGCNRRPSGHIRSRLRDHRG